MYRILLVKAKKDLYRTLINMKPDDLTDSDADLMFQLSKDDDIQECLKK